MASAHKPNQNGQKFSKQDADITEIRKELTNYLERKDEYLGIINENRKISTADAEKLKKQISEFCAAIQSLVNDKQRDLLHECDLKLEEKQKQLCHYTHILESEIPQLIQELTSSEKSNDDANSYKLMQIRSAISKINRTEPLCLEPFSNEGIIRCLDVLEEEVRNKLSANKLDERKPNRKKRVRCVTIDLGDLQRSPEDEFTDRFVNRLGATSTAAVMLQIREAASIEWPGTCLKTFEKTICKARATELARSFAAMQPSQIRQEVHKELWPRVLMCCSKEEDASWVLSHILKVQTVEEDLALVADQEVLEERVRAVLEYLDINRRRLMGVGSEMVATWSRPTGLDY